MNCCYCLAGAENHALVHDGEYAGHHPNPIRLPISHNPSMNLSQPSFNWLAKHRYIKIPVKSVKYFFQTNYPNVSMAQRLLLLI